MFTDLLKKLTGAEKVEIAPPDARLALAALLVRVAKADGKYSADETQRIDRILCQRHGLGPFEGTKLRGEAEALEAEAPDTVRFTRALKDAVPLEERISIIEALWSVVLEDGIRDEEEDGFLRLVANLLGINDRESNLARQRMMQAR